TESGMSRPAGSGNERSADYRARTTQGSGEVRGTEPAHSAPGEHDRLLADTGGTEIPRWWPMATQELTRLMGTCSSSGSLLGAAPSHLGPDTPEQAPASAQSPPIAIGSIDSERCRLSGYDRPGNGRRCIDSEAGWS